MSLSPEKSKHFRSLGHKLKPVVTIAGKGVNDNVTKELERALHDHELIKVSIKIADRQLRAEVSQLICTSLNATLVQFTGNIALLYRAATKPNPKLSNLIRPL